jgi:hypothetical protein
VFVLALIYIALLMLVGLNVFKQRIIRINIL